MNLLFTLQEFLRSNALKPKYKEGTIQNIETACIYVHASDLAHLCQKCKVKKGKLSQYLLTLLSMSLTKNNHQSSCGQGQVEQHCVNMTNNLYLSLLYNRCKGWAECAWARPPLFLLHNKGLRNKC